MGVCILTNDGEYVYLYRTPQEESKDTPESSQLKRVARNRVRVHYTKSSRNQPGVILMKRSAQVLGQRVEQEQPLGQLPPSHQTATTKLTYEEERRN